MNVLVVDNDPVFLKFAANVLKKEGYTVHTTEDGLGALDALKTFPADVVFIDYVMPNIDGKTLCKILRHDERYEFLYIVMLSAIAAEEWVNFSMIGADACIAKAPLNQMKDFMLETLRDPQTAARFCASGNIIGLDAVVPRGITQELLASKKHFHLLLEKMEEGILEINPDRRIVFCNPAALRIIGTQEQFLLGRPFLDIFQTDDHARMSRLLEDAAVSGKTVTAEAPVVFNDHILNLILVPLETNANHALVIFGDITRHKRIEDELTEANAFLRSILDSSLSVSIISTDLRGNILFWNRGATNIHGYSAEETVGRKTIDILYPSRAERDQVAAVVKEMRDGKGTRNHETRQHTKDGRIIWMKLHLTPRFDAEGHIVGILGIGEDVTESKAFHDDLQKSEERYRTVVENVGVGIVIAQEGRLVFANKTMESFFGLSNEELLAHPNPFEFIHPEDRDLVMNRHFRRLKGEDVPEEYTFRVVDSQDTIHWISVNSVRIDWHGRPATLNFFSDITEQTRMEAEKEQLQVQLQQAQRLEALGTLAGGVAHDVNNLLMGIQGRSSLALMNTPSDDPNHAHLQSIENFVRSGARLTNQLLGLARSGKYEASDTDMNTIVSKVADMFGRTRKEITIDLELAEALWSVEVDQSQFEQVLMNMFVNAWQAMDGTGTLTLRTANRSLDENAAKKLNLDLGDYVTLAISDTGMGMDQNTQAKIFDPFFTTKDRGKERGTGLGLASAYGVVKNHAGAIQVQSELKKGTTFTIYLPAVEIPAEPQPDSPKTVAFGSETILLIDDEEMILDVTSAILKDIGYQVIVANSGSEALEIFSTRRDEIDLIILDMIMPDMSGGEVLDRLKAIQPDCRVLLTSGYNLDGDAQEILDRGCKGFLQKPFTVEDLSRTIRDIIDE